MKKEEGALQEAFMSQGRVKFNLNSYRHPCLEAEERVLLEQKNQHQHF
jgi:hypothetical protein